MAICEQVIQLTSQIERAYTPPHFYIGSLYFYLMGVGQWTPKKDVDILLPDPEPFRQQLLHGCKKAVLCGVKVDTPNIVSKYVDIPNSCLRFGLICETLPMTVFEPLMIPISDKLCVPTLNPNLYLLINFICPSRYKDISPNQTKLSQIYHNRPDLPQIDTEPFIRFTSEMHRLYPWHYPSQRLLCMFDKLKYFKLHFSNRPQKQSALSSMTPHGSL